jgi:hypothetical protein
LVVFSLVVIAALWLGWTILANTAADSLVESNAEAALRWREDLPSALISLAEQQLTAENASPDPDEIRQLAERTLLGAPLEARALRALALSAEKGGDLDKADKLMKTAGARSRRDPTVQIWLFNRDAHRGAFEEALQHADALLRSRPNLQDRIAPTLAAFAMDPDAKTALVQALSDNPPWRPWYLQLLANQTSDPGIAYAVYAELKDTKNPPTDAELLPYLQSLVGAGRFEQAYLTWIHFLPDERRGSIHYAYNGGFDYPVTGLPFDWSMEPITGAITEIVAEGPERGQAVRVEFANRRVAYRHLRKLLILPPGRYRVEGLAKASNLENERGLVWRIVCAEEKKQVLGETSPIKGSFDWRAFDIIFEVPQNSCRAQWLTLMLDARIALEEQVSGDAWFDDLAVRRVETAPRKTSALN